MGIGTNFRGMLTCAACCAVVVPGLLLAQGGPPGRGATTVESMIVRPQNLQSSVTAVGTLLAEASAVLRAEAAGPIVALHFEDGQRVAKGERLFSIEATVLEAEVNEARAILEQSEAAYKRANELVKNRLISATDFDTARANFNVGEARLRSAEARLAKTVVRAPFDGTVGLRKINIGDYATIGQELVDVVRLDPLLVDFSIPETLLASVKPGQSVAVSVGAYTGETFTGQVSAVAPQIDVAGHNIVVRATLPNADLKLRPGLFARVNVTLDVNPDALLVPEEAIWPIGQDKTVFVIDDGKAKQKFVQIGQRKDGVVEIVSGLDAGDEVITVGQMKIFDGAAVTSNSAGSGAGKALQ